MKRCCYVESDLHKACSGLTVLAYRSSSGSGAARDSQPTSKHKRKENSPSTDSSATPLKSPTVAEHAS